MDQLVCGSHVGGDQGVQTLHRGNAAIGLSDIPKFLNVCWPTHWPQDTGPPGESQAAPDGDTKARLGYKGVMRAVLKTTDLVVLNYAASLLSQQGIESVVFDSHASVMDGSMGFLPRRLMVLDEDFAQADRLLRDAVPEAM
jgi:hypothetical protein